MLDGFNYEAFKEFERDGFNRVAFEYDRSTAQVTSQVNEVILDAVGIGYGWRLLDVACGTGRLSARSSEATGNSDWIRLCRKYGYHCSKAMS